VLQEIAWCIVSRHSAAVGLAWVLLGATSAAAGEACAQVPPEAKGQFRAAVNQLLGSRVALTDWDGQPANVSGTFSCREAVNEDFDGSGTQDIVALYVADESAAHSLLLSSFGTENGWRASVIEILPAARSLSLLPGGTDRRSPTIAKPLRAGEQALVAARSPGVGLRSADACLGFFLGDHRWVFVQTACP
jgi:hypothetical protein